MSTSKASARAVLDTNLSKLATAQSVVTAKTQITPASRPYVYDAPIFVTVNKADASGSGIKELITTATKIERGINTFDDKPLPTGNTVTITHLRVLGSDSDVTAVSASNDTYGSQKIEPSIQNAVLKIVQDKTLVELPVRLLANRGVGASTADDFYELINPVNLIPEIPFNFVIESAQGSEQVTAGRLMVEGLAVMQQAGASRLSC